jgi:hypothetical protein
LDSPIYHGIFFDSDFVYYSFSNWFFQSNTKLRSNAQTLWTAFLALVYSSAEYCAPVWLNSAHVHKLDVQLNNIMRLITGTVKSTELQWLPVLGNIASAKLRREAALFRELKTMDHIIDDCPIHAFEDGLLTLHEATPSSTCLTWTSICDAIKYSVNSSAIIRLITIQENHIKLLLPKKKLFVPFFRYQNGHP